MPLQNCILPTCFLPSYKVTVDFTSPGEAMNRAISARVPDLQPLPKVSKAFEKFEIPGTYCECAADSPPGISAAVVDSKTVMIKNQHGVNRSFSSIQQGDKPLLTHLLQANSGTPEHQLGSALIGQLPPQRLQQDWKFWPQIVPIPYLDSTISISSAFPPVYSKTIEDTRAPMLSVQHASILSSTVMGKSVADSCSRLGESNSRLLQPNQVLPKIIEHMLPDAQNVDRPWQCAFVPEPDLNSVPVQELSKVPAFETAVVKDILAEVGPVTLCCSLEEHVKNQINDSSNKRTQGHQLVRVELRVQQSCTSPAIPGHRTCYVECLLAVLHDNRVESQTRSSGVIPVPVNFDCC